MDVHLVDGTYELFRAYYGAPSSTAPDGREVGAARSFARSMLLLVTREGATHVGIAFDHVVESFRNALFDGYKTGDGIEPALAQQFELVERIAHALGFVAWPMIEYEADDALATFARRAAGDPSVERVLVLSPDKDLTQCVVDARVVTVDRRRERVLDATGVRERFGVGPASIPDYLALVGDSADGIPGIPRWGARSTAAVLSAFEHLEEIPRDPATWAARGVAVRGAKSLAANLVEGFDDALLYRRLATLVSDVPLAESVADLAWGGARRAELEALALELGDRELVERVPRWM